MLMVRNIENKTMYIVQELHLGDLCKVFSTSLVSSIFSVYASAKLSTKVFLHLQLS